MKDATSAGLLRAVKDCDSMQIRCTGMDGSVVTLDFSSRKRFTKRLFRDIAYALEDFTQNISRTNGRK